MPHEHARGFPSPCLIAVFTVGRGPVPRHAPVCAATIRGLWTADVFRSGCEIAGDRPPRYDEKTILRSVEPKTMRPKKRSPHRRARACPSPCPGLRSNHPCLWAVGVFRRDREIAGDRPPRYGEKNASPSRRARACPSPSFGCQIASPCSSGAPAPEPFGSGCSRTTELGPMPSGIRPPQGGINTETEL